MIWARILLATSLVHVLACHPFAPYWPSAIKQNAQGAGESVEIIVDNWGVPHIFGDKEDALAFALGFMHGRDRRFQILAIKYAASGRLSEIFGKRTLDLDRMLRMLSFNINEQFLALEERDRQIMSSYANGVNEGIKRAGLSIEESLLGVKLESFRPIDSLLIGRLQAWELAQDFQDELARWRIAKASTSSDALSSIFIRPVWTAQVPIVGESGRFSPLGSKSIFPPVSILQGWGTSREGEHDIFSILQGAEAKGSNSYVVAGKWTESGKPILCNDPHLEHRAPGIFYLAHLEHPQFSMMGATSPGIPAMVIGRGRQVAFGMTASFADVQDLVRLSIVSSDPESYVVDGKELKMSTFQERFVYGSAPEDVLIENWHSTIFGIVLPPVFAKLKDKGEEFALQWAGFLVGDVNRAPVSGFWELAKSNNIEEASLAIDKFSLSGMNVALAFVDGTIAYRLAALVPNRRDKESGNLPQDGRFSNALWNGFIPMHKRPGVTNPSKGFIVAANQRIIGDHHDLIKSIGTNSASWSRALRIHQRVDELVQNAGKKKVSADALLSIQQDTVSPEAQAIAPILAAFCPRNIEPFKQRVATQFCKAIRDFNGDFSETSRGALPYVRLLHAIRSVILRGHFDEAVAAQIESRPFTHLMVTQALLQQSTKEFGKDDRLRKIVEQAAPIALRQIVNEAGTSLKSWEWGRSHTLKGKGALYRAPIIGSMFATQERPQGGNAHAPRAEAGLPVKTGAVFRMIAEMLDEPKAKMILDTGNGGTPGHPHFEDMTERWSRGEPIDLPVEHEAILKKAEEHFWLKGN